MRFSSGAASDEEYVRTRGGVEVAFAHKVDGVTFERADHSSTTQGFASRLKTPSCFPLYPALCGGKKNTRVPVSFLFFSFLSSRSHLTKKVGRAMASTAAHPTATRCPAFRMKRQGDARASALKLDRAGAGASSEGERAQRRSPV